MRLQGRVTHWNDDKGFGFVYPIGGGQKAFVHIKAFSQSSYRPVDGDLISYDLSSDQKGRYVAKDVRFAGGDAKLTRAYKLKPFGTIFVSMFFISLAIATMVFHLPLTLIGLYLVTSIVTYIVYAIDKSAAQDGRRRTPESTLHLLSFVGGWPGALLAQKKLHHKSRKMEFQVGYWLTVIANCWGLGWMLTTKAGYDFLGYIAKMIP
ncbi:cold shock and DUF1294 domain-containing protein [Methyloradius palustris]|uniref:DNA-binding protein n=1 Tax=Methyloradius palustris TaxID=2778876 RepID=A0A8D5FYU1_9PROT|nr:cold shock and DUF1294 domain-containing protein [Methyloradius palustris]BCM24679.1 DNA-binding protein [Methyloradius palustris]